MSNAKQIVWKSTVALAALTALTGTAFAQEKVKVGFMPIYRDITFTMFVRV